MIQELKDVSQAVGLNEPQKTKTMSPDNMKTIQHPTWNPKNKSHLDSICKS